MQVLGTVIEASEFRNAAKTIWNDDARVIKNCDATPATQA
jgi:hypothetical protein